MSVVTRVATGTPVTTNSGGPLTPALTGYAIGDLLLYFTAEGPGSDTLTTPSGWTRLNANNRAKQIAVFGKIAASTSESIPSVQWSVNISNQAFAVVHAYRGTKSDLSSIIDNAGASSIDVETTSAANCGGSFGTFTPATAGCLILHFGVKIKTSASDATVFTPPDSFSAVTTVIQAGSRCAYLVEEWIQTTAAAVSGSAASGSVSDATAQSTEGCKFALLAAPTANFTAGPTVTPHTDGFTVGYTSDSNATAFLVALLKGSPAPANGAALRTGTLTGLAARLSKSCTATVADSQTFTGLTLPIYDLYALLNNANGDSAIVALTSKLKSPASGRQYETISGALSSTSPFAGLAPPVASGDIIDIAATSPLTYPVIVSPSGDVEIDSGGDLSREILAFNIYDASAQAMYFTADSSFVVNNAGPNIDQGLDPNNAFLIVLPPNATITPQDVGDAIFGDQYGDSYEVSEVTSLLGPLGLSINNDNQLVGTTPLVDSAVIQPELIAADDFGGSVTCFGTIIVGKVPIPDCKTLDEADGIAKLANFSLNEDSLPFSSLEPAGTVMDMSPAAGTKVDPGSTVILFISTGSIVAADEPGLATHSFQCTPIDGVLDLHHPTG
jgi:hypothetical protein